MAVWREVKILAERYRESGHSSGKAENRFNYHNYSGRKMSCESTFRHGTQSKYESVVGVICRFFAWVPFARFSIWGTKARYGAEPHSFAFQDIVHEIVARVGVNLVWLIKNLCRVFASTKGIRNIGRGVNSLWLCPWRMFKILTAIYCVHTDADG